LYFFLFYNSVIVLNVVGFYTQAQPAVQPATPAKSKMTTILNAFLEPSAPFATPPIF